MQGLRRFFRGQEGPTSVEYAVLLAGIIIVCLSAVTLVGGQTVNFWLSNQQSIDAAYGGS